MKKINLFQFLFALFALASFGMIYWSSLLVETDLKLLHDEIREIKQETASLNQKIRYAEMREPSIGNRPQIDPNLPNLLKDDAFYLEMLPARLGEHFRSKGILKEAMVGRPDHLHPFNSFKEISKMIDMCSVQVATLETGKYETLAKDMAIKIEARARKDLPGMQEYWIHLRDDVYWQPLKPSHLPGKITLNDLFLQKHKVTAHDFKFFYDAIMNPYVSEAKAASLRTYYSDIEAIEVVDDLTFIVRWKPYVSEKTEYKVKYTALSLTGSLQPLACFVYQHFTDGKKIIEEGDDPDIYKKSSIWAQNFMHHWAKNIIVSCGPYLFNGMDDEGIHFIRNPDYYNPFAVLVEGRQITFKESLDAIWQDFKSGKIDLCTLSPNQLPELENFLESNEYKLQKNKGMKIETLDYVDMSYYYIGWNTAKPFFKNPKIRKALTLAIDREKIIEQNLNQMAISISGPFFRYSPSYDPGIFPLPYNIDIARAILEEEGWIDIDGDGIREKIIDNKKLIFSFKLYYFVKSLSSKVIAEYISTALKELGIDCQICGLDLADISRQFDDKNFDALFMGWKLGTPPEDPRQLWHSSGAHEKGSSNAICFSHPKIDQIIEDLNYEHDRQKRIQLYHAFHHIIHEEQPYTFLYTPKVKFLYREYVKNIFIPLERQDLIAGADISEPNMKAIWIEK